MSRIHSIFKQSALATALALVTLATPTAFAQSHYRGHDRGHHDDRRDHRDYRDARRDYRDDRRDYRDYRKDVRKAYRQDQRNYRRWARGQYIPRDYMASRYYINDYRSYRPAAARLRLGAAVPERRHLLHGAAGDRADCAGVCEVSELGRLKQQSPAKAGLCCSQSHPM